jgi:hypothetical protein
MRFPSIHSPFSLVRVDWSDVSLKLQILERLILFVELHGSGFASVIISCFANIEEIVAQGCVLSAPQPPVPDPSSLRHSESRPVEVSLYELYNSTNSINSASRRPPIPDPWLTNHTSAICPQSIRLKPETGTSAQTFGEL